MNIIFLGAPGAGKGTCANKICAEHGIPHISTGDIFRANMRNKTELGMKAKSFMDTGALVPDSLVIEIVADRLQQDDCNKGYVLDGFPRTIPQAEALEKIATIDYVINLEVDDEIIIKRLEGRRACACGNTSHVKWLNGSTKCPKCGMEMYLRDDDRPETVQNRLAIYNKETAPLIGYYTKKGMVTNIDGTGEVEDVLPRVQRALKK